MTNCNRTYFPSPWAHPASRLFLVGWKEDSFPLTIPALPLYTLPAILPHRRRSLLLCKTPLLLTKLNFCECLSYTKNPQKILEFHLLNLFLMYFASLHISSNLGCITSILLSVMH